MSPCVIAVLEDDPVLAFLVEDYLVAAGYDVRLWDPGEAPYAFVCRVKPDLVLLELRLQRPDAGLDLLTQLWDDPSRAQLPIIICSGDTLSLNTHAPLFQSQGCAVLTKPFKLIELLNLTHTSLGDTVTV